MTTSIESLLAEELSAPKAKALAARIGALTQGATNLEAFFTGLATLARSGVGAASTPAAAARTRKSAATKDVQTEGAADEGGKSKSKGKGSEATPPKGNSEKKKLYWAIEREFNEKPREGDTALIALWLTKEPDLVESNRKGAKERAAKALSKPAPTPRVPAAPTPAPAPAPAPAIAASLNGAPPAPLTEVQQRALAPAA